MRFNWKKLIIQIITLAIGAFTSSQTGDPTPLYVAGGAAALIPSPIESKK